MSEQVQWKQTAMAYSLTDTWRVASEQEVFGHKVTIHQNGSAVIWEIDGLCIVGDYAVMDGKSTTVFPRHMAMCRTIEDAKRAVEYTYAKRTERIAEDS